MSDASEIILLLLIIVFLIIIIYFIYYKSPQPTTTTTTDPYCMHSTYGCCPLSPTMRVDAVGSNC